MAVTTGRNSRLALITLVILSLIMAALMFLLVIRQGQRQSPPMEFTSETYDLHEGCPGDIVTYYSKLEVFRPSTFMTVPTYMREHDASGDNAILAHSEDVVYANVPSPRILEDADGFTFTVPDLPPGEYARVRAIHNLNEFSEIVWAIQPITILNDCPN